MTNILNIYNMFDSDFDGNTELANTITMILISVFFHWPLSLQSTEGQLYIQFGYRTE